MSGFTALNVEPEDNLEEDVDDTREIQLEEAFKLYQIALKLHSQGPQYFQEAQEAYDELFKSEVFKYPEVVSEFAHDELDDEGAAAASQADITAAALLPNNAAESSASSIPQLIYLAFKNRGQFLLDVARHQMADKTPTRVELCRSYNDFSKDSLRQFAKALERDDTDLDLWKKAARVADVAGSQRIVRFCLESVLAGEDDDGQQTVDLSGLDEAYAAGELEEVIDLLQDDVSRLQSSNLKPKPKLLEALRKSNDPFPFLPKRAKTLEYLDDRYRPMNFTVPKQDLKPKSNDIFCLGEEIIEVITKIQAGEGSTNSATSATTVKVVLQEADFADCDVEMAMHANDAEQDTHQKEAAEHDMQHETAAAASASGTQLESALEPVTTHEDDRQDDDKMDLAIDGDTIEVRSAAPIQTDPTGTTSRKRSSTVAGNDEPEVRSKSKRLRARESIADLAAQEEETVHEHPQFFLDQLAIYEQTDQVMFDVVNSLLAKFDSPQYLAAEAAKHAFWSEGNEHESGLPEKDFRLLTDLRHALITWTDDKSQAIANGHKNQDLPEKDSGLSQYLHRSKLATPKKAHRSEESAKAVFSSLVTLINEEPTNVYDAARFWLTSILTSSNVKGRHSPSLYLQEAWPVGMMHKLGRFARNIEDYLWSFMQQRLPALSQASRDKQDGFLPTVQEAFEFSESLFEIFLDMAASPPDLTEDDGADVESVVRATNSDRLRRWAGLTGGLLQVYLNCTTKGMSDPLVLRFVWTSVAHARLDDDIDKPHIVLLLGDLRVFMEQSETEAIRLPNNTAMPEISVPAIEHQLSVLSTSDFFAKVFHDDNSDPVAVIEMLEPMLDSMAQARCTLSLESGTPVRSAQAEELVNFLESNSATLTVALWRRLQHAYTSISYPPKVVSCLFRVIETITAELYTQRHLDLDPSTRQVEMFKWLHDIDEMMNKLGSRLPDEPNAFECFDTAHLHTSIGAITKVIKLLHGFAIYEDSVRIGQTVGPQLKGVNATKQYEKSKDRLREMLVRAWYLQYLLLKEVTIQEASSYPGAADDLAQYLCSVHNSLGARQYCRYVNKLFVKLVRSELGNLSTGQDYAEEMMQLFYDLYQLRFSGGVGDVDHGCPPDNLDRKTAWTLIPTIMKYAERFNVKDLVKSELKGTIDKMQQALGVVKSSPALQQNKLVIREYLKGVIKATELFDCIRGIGNLPTRPVKADTEIAASSGWYFMLGHLTLSKYKSVKRVNFTSTEELDQAMTLFRQDLNHDTEKWETWYRLAQCFEAKIEDDLIWNSAKLNDSRLDIALLERQAIHSYMMATAVAFRSVEDRPEVAAKIEDMLAEFGTRLYASSRPPLNMEAFKTDKHLRHLSSTTDQTMSKQPYHQPVRQYALWSFAARLLNMKLTDRPKPWMSHYTRAKCLWKMLQSVENQGRVTAKHVIAAIGEAIEGVPKKEKSNEPILEPHLKLVSVVHKMLLQGKISQSQAYQYMQGTRYSHGVNLSQDEDGVDWERYMINILKKLSHADKANWHHRINNRAAHVLYDESPNLAGALGAKHEFTQQIFTKTMTLQVWKPEYERPGRHYVYTGLYVTFFIHLLEQLNDRVSLDSLIRRIRRKTTDFLDHASIWEVAVTAYLRLLRRHGKMPEGRERALFDGMNHEEFTKKSEAMEQWSHDPDTSSVYLDVMREGIDLKRLNNSLMKGPVIDDLIGDAYACLYEEFVKHLPPEEQPKPQPAPLPQGTFINMVTDLAAGESEEAQRARLADTLRGQGDGGAAGPLSLSISAPIGLGLQAASVPLPDVPGQPAPEVQRERAKPGRVKTVTRREIQRKAESAIVKPPPIKTPILSKRPIIELSAKGEADAGSPIDKRLAGVKDHDVDDSRATSRRGSIQDSADGDADGEESGSELSELEDMDDDKKKMLAEFESEQHSRHGDDSDDDEEGQDGEAVAKDDEAEGADDDEEMQDAQDGIEIPDSQENARDSLDQNKESPDEEFHEAREENDMVD